MTEEPWPELAYVNQGYSVRQSREPGVLISERQYRRYIERLDRCKPGGWSEVWLAIAGAAAGVAGASLIGALSLPPTVPSATRDILWVLTGAGSVIFGLCLIAYVTRRHDYREAIDELKDDLVLHEGSIRPYA